MIYRVEILQGKPQFSAPADHGEGGGSEVKLGPGEASNTAEWY